MSKVKSAPEKKRLSYKSDHYTTADEYPKGFRKGWPQKRARINRAFRRKVAQTIDTTVQRDPSPGESLIVEHIKRKPAKKHGTESLQERIARTQNRRAQSYGAKKARRGRGTESHVA